MEFEDILESLINPGEDGASPDIFDQLRGAHTGALEAKDSLVAESTAATAAVQAQLDAVSAKLAEAQAANSDKLMELLMGIGESGEGDPDLSDDTLEDNAEEGEMSDDEFFEKGDK